MADPEIEVRGSPSLPRRVQLRTGSQMARILIVDDEDSFRDVLRLRLEDTFEIIDTGHAAEALALALQHQPDAILLDLSMPEFSGFELCQTLSSLSHTQSIPIFVVSAESAAKFKPLCQNLGAMEYLEKPVDFDDLKTRLTVVLRGKQPKPRPEVSVRLRVILKLRGTDANGIKFETLTTTDEISARGFACGCTAPLKKDAIVDVFDDSHEGHHVGQARAVSAEWSDTPFPRYRFQFVGRPRQWFLQ